MLFYVISMHVLHTVHDLYAEITDITHTQGSHHTNTMPHLLIYGYTLYLPRHVVYEEWPDIKDPCTAWLWPKVQTWVHGTRI